MSLQTWQETLAVSQGDGTALTNTVTATTIIPAAAIYTFPANSFAIGRRMRIKASGRMDTVVTTPGTLTFLVRIGGISVFTGGAMALNTTAQTNATWDIVIDLTCRAIGASTTFIGTGVFTSRAVIGSGAAGTTGVGTLVLPDTAPVVGTAVDGTVATAVDMFAQWSIASPSNSIRTHQYSLELLN